MLRCENAHYMWEKTQHCKLSQWKMFTPISVFVLQHWIKVWTWGVSDLQENRAHCCSELKSAGWSGEGWCHHSPFSPTPQIVHRHWCSAQHNVTQHCKAECGKPLLITSKSSVILHTSPQGSTRGFPAMFNKHPMGLLLPSMHCISAASLQKSLKLHQIDLNGFFFHVSYIHRYW